MPGCAHISGYLHIEVQTAVYIKTINALGSDLCLCSCKIFSTQEHSAASIARDESDAVFSWKGDRLKQYRKCTLNALIFPEDDGKGHGTDLIVDDGGDIIIIIQQVNKAEELLLKYDAVPDPISTWNSYFNIVPALINHQLEGGEIDKWNKIANTCMVVSEETTAGFHRIYTMEKIGYDHQKLEITRTEAMCYK